MKVRATQYKLFQSTPPARGATSPLAGDFAHRKISIHAPREGGDLDKLAAHYGVARISIHAPREGGDEGVVALWADMFAISIHAPREGGDLAIWRDNCSLSNFNPRPPRGGRLFTSR